MAQGKVNFASTFENPVHATIDGNAVTLLAVGEVEGMSPAYLAVDADGRSRWASIDDVQIHDTNCLPITTGRELAASGRR